MALTTTVTYTPFQEVSFGYGSNEIATNYSTEFPNPTDIVIVEILHTNGNFDSATGHISTDIAVGTAIPTMVKTNLGYHQWRVEGERDDVDAVLAQLVFFPSDYPASRPYDAAENPNGWRNDLDSYIWKENQTTGIYTDEQPATPTDSVFAFYVRDNSGTSVDTGVITFASTTVTNSYTRPYFTTEAMSEVTNIASSGIGSNFAFGEVAYSDENAHLTVTLETFAYDGIATNTYTDSTVFEVIGYDQTYVGDKIPNANPASGIVFEFTGTAKEVNAFLETVRVKALTSTTFESRLRISNGIVGSDVHTIHWSAQPIRTSVFPDITAQESYDVHVNEPAYTVTNASEMPEIDAVALRVDLDTDAQAAIAGIYLDAEKTIPVSATSGSWTHTGTTFGSVISALNSLVFELNSVDYAGTFTFDITITAENATIGSSYSSVTETVTVTVVDTPEYVYTDNGSVSWNEDQTFSFDSGIEITDFVYGGSNTYTVDARVRYTASGVDADVTELALSGFPLTGTKTEANAALAAISVSPDLDFISKADNDSTDFRVEYSVVRVDDSVALISFADTGVHTTINNGTRVVEIEIPSTTRIIVNNDPNFTIVQQENTQTSPAAQGWGLAPAISVLNEGYELQELLLDNRYELHMSYPNDAVEFWAPATAGSAVHVEMPTVSYVDDEFYAHAGYYEDIAIVQSDSGSNGLGHANFNYTLEHLTITNTVQDVDDFSSNWYLRRNGTFILNGTTTFTPIDVISSSTFDARGVTDFYDYDTTHYNITTDKFTYTGESGLLSVDTSYTTIPSLSWETSSEQTTTTSPYWMETEDVTHNTASNEFVLPRGYQKYSWNSTSTISQPTWEKVVLPVKVDLPSTSAEGEAATENVDVEFELQSNNGRFVSTYIPKVNATTQQPVSDGTLTMLGVDLDSSTYTSGDVKVTQGWTAKAIAPTVDEEIYGYSTRDLVQLSSAYGIAIINPGVWERYVEPQDITHVGTNFWVLGKGDTGGMYLTRLTSGFQAGTWDTVTWDTWLVENNTGDIWGGAIGSVGNNGDIVVVTADKVTDSFKIVHYDSSSNGIVTFTKTISKATWNTAGKTFDQYFSTDTDKLVHCNNNGWMMLGPYLYYWNGSDWIESGVYNSADTITAAALASVNVLGNDIAFIAGRYYRLGHPRSTQYTVHDTGITSSGYAYCLKQSNYFQEPNGVRRFTN